MTACNGERAAIVRAGKITGPPGPQDDLNCWVRRAARGDRAATPGGARPAGLLD